MNVLMVSHFLCVEFKIDRHVVALGLSSSQLLGLWWPGEIEGEVKAMFGFCLNKGV